MNSGKLFKLGNLALIAILALLLVSTQFAHAWSYNYSAQIKLKDSSDGYLRCWRLYNTQPGNYQGNCTWANVGSSNLICAGTAYSGGSVACSGISNHPNCFTDAFGTYDCGAYLVVSVDDSLTGTCPTLSGDNGYCGTVVYTGHSGSTCPFDEFTYNDVAANSADQPIGWAVGGQNGVPAPCFT